MSPSEEDRTPPPLQQRQTYYGDPASQVEGFYAQERTRAYGCARISVTLAGIAIFFVILYCSMQFGFRLDRVLTF